MTPPGESSSGRALAVVSLAVLLAGSIWFSGTAAIPALRELWSLGDTQAAWLTVAVQLGFITGTFLYSILNIADVFNARRVFLVSALLGRRSSTRPSPGSHRGWGRRWCSATSTGVTLAGVYPVAMKIVASWFRDGARLASRACWWARSPWARRRPT